MKKLSLLTALLCASLLTFADAVESEYCGYSGNETKSGNTYVTLTWETLDNGDVQITMGNGEGSSSCSFRNGGFEGGIDAFIVSTDNFETSSPASNYFTAEKVYSGNTFTLVKTANLPLGCKIKHVGAGHALAWTVNGADAYTFPDFVYTYGGVCSAEVVLTSLVLSASDNIVKVNESIELTVQALDQYGMSMDAEVNLSVNPTTAGNIENNVFTAAQVGVVTITATSGTLSKSLTLHIVPSDNLALSKAVEAGYNPGNAAEQATAANDGNNNSAWVTWADQPTDSEWWYVDLEDKYNLTGIEVLWGADYSTNYIIQVRDAAPSADDKADDEAWETLATQTCSASNQALYTNLAGAGRYVRIHSLTRSANCIRMREVRIFGTEYVDMTDSEAPVMVSATEDSKTWNKVVLAVSATDNVGVTKYHVVDAAKSIDMSLTAEDGKITVTGLSALTSYNFTVTALDAAHNESANSIAVAVTTKANVPSVAAPAPTWPAAQVKSIYSDAYEFAPASLVSYNEGWWNNPNMTVEAIGEDQYLHYDLYRNGMIGGQFAKTSVIGMEKMHIDVYASAAGSITFRWITEGDAEAINQTKKTLTLVAEQWNSFDIDLADFGEHNWANLFQYAIEGYEAGGLVGEHIAVDNLYLYRETALVDEEAPTAVTAQVAAASYFLVQLSVSATDNSGAVNFVVKNGEEEVATGAGASGATVNIIVSHLTPSTQYTFSVIAKDDAGNAAPAATIAAPAAAPRPSFTDKTAVAVFCDELDGAPAIVFGNWGQNTIAQVVELAEGDHVVFGANFNFLGWELAPAVDATDMEYLHVDLFSPNITSLFVTPISPNREGRHDITLTPNEWNSVDVALSVFEAANINWSNVFQFKFADASPVGGELFIDNVYFYKSTTGTGVENTWSAGAVSKFIENGALYIVRDGKVYSVQGVLVR